LNASHARADGRLMVFSGSDVPQRPQNPISASRGRLCGFPNDLTPAMGQVF
jgi:hypothetical protein